MERKVRHLVHRDGRWHLEGDDQPQGAFDTKAEALAEGQRWGNELQTRGTNSQLVIHREDGSEQRVTVLLRIDTPIEVDYYNHGGILPFVLRQLLAA